MMVRPSCSTIAATADHIRLVVAKSLGRFATSVVMSGMSGSMTWCVLPQVKYERAREHQHSSLLMWQRSSGSHSRNNRTGNQTCGLPLCVPNEPGALLPPAQQRAHLY